MSDANNTSVINQTGAGSSNTSTTTVTNTSQYSSTNNSSTSNNVTVQANTGSNTTTNNTTVTGSGSGNINVSLGVHNGANNTSGGSTGGVGGSNTTTTSSSITNTGAGSTNSSSTTVNNSSSVTHVNNATVNNNVNVQADTGHNLVANNTSVSGGGSGNISIAINLDNQVNSVITPTTPPVNPGGGDSFGGVGGDFLPLPLGMGGDQVVLADAPRYFTAGANELLAQGALFITLSFVAVMLSRFYKRIVRFFKVWGAASLIVLLVLLPAAPHTFAAETPSATARGPQTQVGPQGAVGPQGPVGAQGTTGAQGCVGAGCVAPTVTASDTASSATGALSDNAVSATATDSVAVTNTNTATINNGLNANLETGSNTADGNTNLGQVQTGNINGAVNIVNVANSVFAPGSSVGSQSVNGGNASTVNLSQATDRTSLTNTGAGSNNSNVLQGTNTLSVINNNTATANNGIVINGDTGNNEVSQNTNAAGLTTGNINFILNVINMMNLMMPNVQVNLDFWSVLLNNPNANLNMGFGDTGAGSTNNSSTSSNNNQNVSVTNLADSNTNVNANLNTGNNTESQNTTTGEIHTGDANLNGQVVNVVNSLPTLYIVNVVGGTWNGSLQGLPENAIVLNQLGMTGAGSTNSSSTDLNNTSTFGLNNTANVNNNINLNFNTGDNTANQNTSMGGITTGSINAYVNILNVLNSLTNAHGQFNIGIINLFVEPNGQAATGGTTNGVGGGGPETQTAITQNSQGDTTIDLSNPADPQIVTPTPRVVVPTTYATGNIEAVAEVADTPISAPLIHLADVAKAAASSKSLPVSDTAKRLPIGMILVGIFAAFWIGIELLAYVEKRRISDY